MNGVEPGSIYRMVLTPAEGVRPKNTGDTGRTKYFVVLGIDNEMVVVGTVLINSRINPGLFLIIT